MLAGIVGIVVTIIVAAIGLRPRNGTVHTLVMVKNGPNYDYHWTKFDD